MAKYKPSTIWTHKRNNPDQTECEDANCEVRPYCLEKYGDDSHFHDAGEPENFDEWYAVEGHSLVENKHDAEIGWYAGWKYNP